VTELTQWLGSPSRSFQGIEGCQGCSLQQEKIVRRDLIAPLGAGKKLYDSVHIAERGGEDSIEQEAHFFWRYPLMSTCAAAQAATKTIRSNTNTAGELADICSVKRGDPARLPIANLLPRLGQGAHCSVELRCTRDRTNPFAVLGCTTSRWTETMQQVRGLGRCPAERRALGLKRWAVSLSERTLSLPERPAPAGSSKAKISPPPEYDRSSTGTGFVAKAGVTIRHSFRPCNSDHVSLWIECVMAAAARGVSAPQLFLIKSPVRAAMNVLSAQLSSSDRARSSSERQDCSAGN